MPLTLTPLAPPTRPRSTNHRCDARAWCFPKFFTLDPVQIAQLPLLIGNRAQPTGELFQISGNGADQQLMIEGDVSWLDWLGAGLAGGSIFVRGGVGHFCGAEMSAGQISVLGDAGHGTGCQLSGGMLIIHGNAGNNTAGCFPGSLRGQRGGTVFIGGAVGNHAGQYQRRGLLVIGGNAAAEAGLFQRAGTIIIGGTAGPRAGQGMRRGTICILKDNPSPGVEATTSQLTPSAVQAVYPHCLTPGRFALGYQGEPLVLKLLAGQLRELMATTSASQKMPQFFPAIDVARICEVLQGKLRLFHGDLLAAGQGEVWFAAG